MSATEAPSDRAKVTVGIIDDYAILLESLRSWLARNADDLEVVIVASTFKEYVLAPAFPPRVTLVGELRSEVASVPSRIRACIAAGSQVIVVAGESSARARVLRDAGAVATMPRKTAMVDIVAAIREAARASEDRPAVVPESLERPKLSPSEHRALAYYVQGLSTQDVATAMNVKYETAKTFLRRVRQKYAKVDRAAGKRADLIVRATEDGIL